MVAAHPQCCTTGIFYTCLVMPYKTMADIMNDSTVLKNCKDHWMCVAHAQYMSTDIYAFEYFVQ